MINIGSLNIDNIYVGNNDVSKIYIGNDLVYEASGGLPAEYQEVEYIESTGSQYIDTGLEGKNGYTFETKVQFTNFVNTYSYLAGFGTNSSNRIYFTRVQSGSTDGWTFDGDSHNLSNVSIFANTDYVYKSIMETGNQQLYRNSVLLDSNTRTDVNSFGNIWLFASDYNNSSNGACACKMYYAKFTYNNGVVRNFVPCYRKADGEIGMYDIRNDVFYTNAGSGTFLKGNDV